MRERGSVPDYVLLRDWALTVARKPSKHNDALRGKLNGWLSDIARQYEDKERRFMKANGVVLMNNGVYHAEGAYFAQFSQDQAAEALFDGKKNVTQAKRAIRECIDNGLMLEAFNGRRGFPTVYLMPPFELVNKDGQHECWIVARNNGLRIEGGFNHSGDTTE